MRTTRALLTDHTHESEDRPMALPFTLSCPVSAEAEGGIRGAPLERLAVACPGEAAEVVV